MADTVEVLVGVVGRPHGLKGELAVHVRTDEPERRLAAGSVVTVDGRQVRIARSRWQSGVLLLAFEGVTDRTTAERWRGAELWAHVPAGEHPIEPDEYYDRQLVGLEVRGAGGRVVGVIGSVLHLPAHDLLVVDTDRGERLVPFVAALVPVVDVSAGYVQVADIGGLLQDADDADAGPRDGGDA